MNSYFGDGENDVNSVKGGREKEEKMKEREMQIQILNHFSKCYQSVDIIVTDSWMNRFKRHINHKLSLWTMVLWFVIFIRMMRLFHYIISGSIFIVLFLESKT